MIRGTIVLVLMLAAIGAGVVGVVSYRSKPGWGDDSVLVSSDWHGFCLAASAGVVKINWHDCEICGGPHINHKPRCYWSGGDLKPGLRSRSRTHHTLGEFMWSRQSDGWYATYEAHCPLWLPFVLLAAYPPMALIRGPLRRRLRRKRGLCIPCGYDLTGNLSGVCPEYGTEVNRG